MIRQWPSATLPLTDSQWQQWLQELLDTGNVLKSIDPTNPNLGKVAPATPQIGLLAYADGVAWNPGSGEGYYRWTGTAWKYVG
jgi:hypothetical protein